MTGRLFRDKTERALREMMCVPDVASVLEDGVRQYAESGGLPVADDLKEQVAKVREFCESPAKKRPSVNWRMLQELMGREPGRTSVWYAKQLGCTSSWVRATMKRRGWR